jgi:hypothetical protein
LKRDIPPPSKSADEDAAELAKLAEEMKLAVNAWVWKNREIRSKHQQGDL